MNDHESRLQAETRRHFFSECSMGIGSIALASLLADKRLGAEQPNSLGEPIKITNPLEPQVTHFPAKAKNVIFLFMAGGPSQLETFDYKPKLNELSGQPIPDSFVEGKRFAFMGSSHRNDLLGFRPKFKQYGDNGTWVSDYLPRTAGIVDELSIVKTCSTDLFNHAPAKLFMNTGTCLLYTSPSPRD